MYPETQGRTLEELAFCEYTSSPISNLYSESNFLAIVFEDPELAEQAVIAVEKEIHDVDSNGFPRHALEHREDIDNKI